MTTLRHRLQFFVAVWLIFQVATLSALVPQDCCAAHKAQHKKQHHAPAAAAHDSHHAMNHEMAGHSGHDAAPASPLEQCVMRGTCKGPMSAVVALLSNQGVPPLATFTIAPDLGETSVAGAASEHVSSRLASPDPPPPRA